MLTSHMLRATGEILAGARWPLASVGVLVTGVWLGKRLGRYFASHHEF
ncbi:MAG TPA: hypothetical protein VHJ18_20025 [Streptosporangiaceae bacterium]|jgi:hypothetical protein|nr:hypothetical protein [Streptosporangiaceae bacterium]